MKKNKAVTMVYSGYNNIPETKELLGDEVGYNTGRQAGPFETARIWNEKTSFSVPLNRLISIEMNERENESRAAAETE